ncbi:MAG: hypothetical protein ACYC8S_00045 [Minisyncoccota bacterium]
MEFSEIIKSIESKSTKANHELIWAYFFIFHLNKEKLFDYEVEEGPNDLTDVYAKSKSEKFPILKLQLTWAKEKDFSPKIVIKNLKFSTEIILEAVKRKYEKYEKQGKADSLKEIILVIQGDLPSGWDDLVDDKKVKEEIVKYPFRGIYYITPPGTKSSLKDRTPIMHDGFVLCFKEAFQLT